MIKFRSVATNFSNSVGKLVWMLIEVGNGVGKNISKPQVHTMNTFFFLRLCTKYKFLGITGEKKGLHVVFWVGKSPKFHREPGSGWNFDDGAPMAIGKEQF